MGSIRKRLGNRKHTVRKRSAYRRNRFIVRGGNDPKSSCKALFELKGNRKWKTITPKVSSWTKVRYSWCKRRHPKLYKSLKQISAEQAQKTPDRQFKTQGILFEPSLKGKSASYIALVNKTNLEVHSWLDQHGWTDKNIVKADRMRQDRLRGT